MKQYVCASNLYVISIFAATKVIFDIHDVGYRNYGVYFTQVNSEIFTFLKQAFNESLDFCDCS